MEINNQQNGFEYTYSATEQEELKRIRSKYTPREENKMDRVRRLDSEATRKAMSIALTIGIIGTLILGFGMSMCMEDLGSIFGLYGNTAMLVGIIVGVVGGIIAGIAYPIYNKVLRRERERIAPEIIRLTDELMK